jgi:hypothetical protein
MASEMVRVSEVFSHLCLEVASKLANFSQLAWVLDCRWEAGNTRINLTPRPKRPIYKQAIWQSSEITNAQSAPWTHSGTPEWIYKHTLCKHYQKSECENWFKMAALCRMFNDTSKMSAVIGYIAYYANFSPKL